MHSLQEDGYCLETGKIAILLATYNGEKYIEEQLESIKQQTFQNFCCFIHDDGSKDQTRQKIQDFCDKNPEHFVFIDAPSTGGSKYNFMFLLKMVVADYIMFCDQDDVWLPDKIEKSYSELKQKERNNIPICVYSDVKLVDQELNVISPSYFSFTGKNPKKNSLVDLLKQNVVIGCTMMINRPLREIAVSLKNQDNIYMHDWWIALIATEVGKIYYINDTLSLYRQHGGNVVGAKKVLSKKEKIFYYLNIKNTQKEKNEKLNIARNFANELIQVLNESARDYQFLTQLAAISKKNKITRIIFYYTNHMFYDGSNVLWQIIWV